MDPRIPARDFEHLQVKTKLVRDWVNTSIAHLTAKNRPKEDPPLQAIHDAVDVVTALFVKYMQLIHGTTIARGVIMQPRPHVFRFPWIEDDDAYRDVMKRMEEAERRWIGTPQA